MKVRDRQVCGLVIVCAALAVAGVTVHDVRGQETIPGVSKPGDSLLVVDMAGGRLVIIDTATRKVRSSVETGPGPHEVAASADGRLAFVANYGTQAVAGRTLSVIEIASGKELRRSDLGAFRRPHGLAVVGGKVYFTAEANRAVGRYDPEADKVDRIIGLGQDGTHMIVASPDDATLYTADIGSGTVTVIRRDTGKLARVAVGGHPEGLAVSPDGRQVWAGQRMGGDVAVIDTESLTVKATVQTGSGMAARLRFTPDGKRVLIPDPRAGRLIVLDASTHKELATLAVGNGPVGALVEPGGRRAFVPLAGEAKVAIIDLESLSVVGSIDTGQVSDGMAWVPGPKGAPARNTRP